MTLVKQPFANITIDILKFQVKDKKGHIQTGQFQIKVLQKQSDQDLAFLLF